MRIGVTDQRGRNEYGDADAPLRIGSSERAHLYLPGVPSVIAHLGVAEGAVFIQSAGEPVQVDGRPLQGSDWLREGTVIAHGGQTIRCQVDTGRVELVLEGAAPSPHTIPPEPEEMVTQVRPAPAEPVEYLMPNADTEAGPSDQPARISPISPLTPASPLKAQARPDPQPSASAIKPAPIQPAQFQAPGASAGRAGGGVAALFKALLLFFVFTLLLGGTAVAWFVFTSSPVTVRTNPPVDSLRFDGGMFPPLELAGQRLMRKGPYVVTLSKEGYRGQTNKVEVKRGENLFEWDLEKLPGIVNIQVELARAGDEASVRIDGVDYGKSPVREQLPEGSYTLEIEAENYVLLSTNLTVRGMGEEQPFSFRLVPRWSRITFRTDPPGAQVKVDGKDVGRSEVWVDLLAGSYGISYELDKHKTVTDRIEVEADQPRALDLVQLPPADGMLKLETTPPGASVNIDGKYRGVSPLMVELSPGAPHELVVSKPGYELARQQVALRSGEMHPLQIRLVERLGRVEFSSSPVGATLLLDGKEQGSANQVLSLPTRPHQVMVRKEGYRDFTRSITPRLDIPLKVEVVLVPLPTTTTPAPPVTPGPGGTPAPEAPPAAAGDWVLFKPGGAFDLGSRRNEQGRLSNETERRVLLTRPFQMARKEVTNREYRVFDPKHRSGRGLDGDEQPVVNLSWQQAAAYCNHLSAKAGLPPAYVSQKGELVAARPIPQGSYRLPTEAEWEFCARLRGGVPDQKYPWGAAYPPPAKSGNFGTIKEQEDGFKETAPVGSFPAGFSGLFDMGGNVAEWCHDYYSMYSVTDRGLQRDPEGPTSGRHRVIRGSSWKQGDITSLRNAYRRYSKSTHDDVGFRLCRSVPDGGE